MIQMVVNKSKEEFKTLGANDDTLNAKDFSISSLMRLDPNFSLTF
jgi:hypothetical protein